jgi:Tol biopolymer transport system component
MPALRCILVALVAVVLSGIALAAPPADPVPDLLVGYTEFSTNLPGGRHGNVVTMRAAVVRADGSGLRLLAGREGYRGVVEFLDVPDFHGGSSDTPAWSADGRSVFYTAKSGGSVELFRVALDGEKTRLTETPPGTLHDHPTPSPDGRWLLYGSQRDGIRQLYAMRLSDRQEHRLTDLSKGRAAMWPHWQPVAARP